ncbi:hypothetical protein KKC1_17990 [Calderihabitans maritimus]|uniref:Uncharacterized protein n=1 Tax=Calderihabitans maritimus TaxID=1246530 RepID=A0A1Z5HT82_9FIRM|nr:hypothetical protein KKC1_17990 [Calderihabitans maritimus]
MLAGMLITLREGTEAFLICCPGTKKSKTSRPEY